MVVFCVVIPVSYEVGSLPNEIGLDDGIVSDAVIVMRWLVTL